MGSDNGCYQCYARRSLLNFWGRRFFVDLPSRDEVLEGSRTFGCLREFSNHDLMLIHDVSDRISKVLLNINQFR